MTKTVLKAGPMPAHEVTAIPHDKDKSFGYVFRLLYESGGMHVVSETCDKDGTPVIREWDLYTGNGNWPLEWCRYHDLHHVCDYEVGSNDG